MIFFGSKGYHDTLGYVVRTCTSCNRLAPFTLLQSKKKFTLYFVPTFSYSTKYHVHCNFCNTATEISETAKNKLQKKLITEAQAKQEIEIHYQFAAPSRPTDTKICPFCAEQIRAAAIVCRYCKRDLG